MPSPHSSPAVKGRKADKNIGRFEDLLCKEIVFFSKFLVIPEARSTAESRKEQGTLEI